MDSHSLFPEELRALRRAIDHAHLLDEDKAIRQLLENAAPVAAISAQASIVAERWVRQLREAKGSAPFLQAFLREFGLDSEEGVALMCLAEALLRIPDTATADRLIEDKFAVAGWETHLGHSDSWFVNAAAWGLLISGRVLHARTHATHWLSRVTQLMARGGETLIRAALKAAMRVLGNHFVWSAHMPEALRAIARDEHRAFRYSFDMLGEAALTALDAERYFHAYAAALEAVGDVAHAITDPWARPSISIKLSALHPRYEYAQRELVLQDLVPRLSALAREAKSRGLTVTLDAEEADRLDLALDIFTLVFDDPALQAWEGLGLAVQAYQKRAPAVLDYLAALARARRKRIPVRLVKGAYWDSEIKRAQERGLADFPVYTRKSATDTAYLYCAHRLLAQPAAFYPQFATHNAHTAAAVLAMADGRRDFEFQRLHGMGDALHRWVMTQFPDVACRVYAPVGRHTELLPYLVRRLLENGANNSFVFRLEDTRIDAARIVEDPVAYLKQCHPPRHARIATPPALYGDTRRNARGYNLCDASATAEFTSTLSANTPAAWRAYAIVGGRAWPGTTRPVTAPADRRRTLGQVTNADAGAVEQALAQAQRAFPAWSATAAPARAAILRKAADLFEHHAAELVACVIHEGGRCVVDAIAELREAVDFLRYYAAQIEQHFTHPIELPGPAGERNYLFWRGRGVFVCISPWNFPLAIFTGQIAAALAAGNSVIAKPAAATPLVATRAIEILHLAGVPVDVLHLLIGDGARVGARLLSDSRVAGVAFTGSTATAHAINVQLSARQGSIVPLIAETGGLNAMLVDSSAQPEQVVADILVSAFNSAGQRCSALRIVYLQREIARRVIGLLGGALAERRLGDPGALATDIGPVIHAQAVRQLHEYCASLQGRARLLYELPVPAANEQGDFFPPRVYLLDKPETLTREVFGPILHIALFDAAQFETVLETINRTGYGLTFGVHSRIQARIDDLAHRIHAGNIYANRSMIGAVVGAQPFGGEGLSGTGPKAGGPHYLHRFACEVVVSQNIAATGGNSALLNTGD